MHQPKRTLLCAFLIASCVILGRILSFRTPLITIGFSFVPIILGAITLGPAYSTFIATISDIIGALLFPTGSYFFGFTITTFLTGLTYGLLLYRKTFRLDKAFLIRLIVSTVLVTGLLNGGLNTIWIIIMNQGASNFIIPLRVLKQLIMAPIQVITMLALCKIFEKRLASIND